MFGNIISIQTWKTNIKFKFVRFHVHQWYSNKTLIGTTKFDRSQSGPINLTSRLLKLLHIGKAKKKKQHFSNTLGKY